MTTNEVELDVLDIEDHANSDSSGQLKPRARRYRIKVDRERFETTDPTPTGREVLALASKTPETYVLSQLMRNGPPTTIAADETVNLRAPGVERFTTTPREAIEG